MGDLVLVAGFVATLVFLVVVLWKAGLRPTKPGQTEMVLIGSAAGLAEKNLWVTALRTAGIHPHVLNTGDYFPT